MEQATLSEFDAKVQLGLLRIAKTVGDDMNYIEILKYLEETWHYLYTNLLVVGVDIYGMEFRTEEEIKNHLDDLRDKIKNKVTKKNIE